MTILVESKRMTGSSKAELNGSAVDPTSSGDEGYAFPATIAQQTFWYLDRLQPGNPALNIPLRFRLTGPLHPEELARALTELVRRHEALRTRFTVVEGELVQIVCDPSPVSLPIDDMCGVADAHRHEAVMSDEAQSPFNLETGPLFRARLLRFGDTDHVLLLNVHHIVADGWSTGLIADEIATLYAAFDAGRPSPLSQPVLQFGDYAVWQEEWLRAPAVATSLAYWKDRLAGLDPLRVPQDKSARAESAFQSRIDSILLPRELTNNLAELCPRHGVTLFMVCLACFKLLLNFRTTRTDIAVGTMVAGRSQVELEPVVGLFVNTLVLRTDLSGDPTFLELLGRVRGTVVGAMDHQDVPFGSVIETVRLGRPKSRNPLFGINFLFQRAFLNPRQAGSVTFTPIPSLSTGTTLDMNWFMVERDEGWRVSCMYDPFEYEPETIGGLLDSFRRILQEAAADPTRPISNFRFPEPGLSPVLDPFSTRTAPEEPAQKPFAQRIVPPPAENQAGQERSDLVRDDFEGQLAEVWHQVLQVQKFDVTDDFFDLGGHSLIAARLVARIHDRFGVRLSPAVLHEHSTIRQLARILKQAAGLDEGMKPTLERSHPLLPQALGTESWNGKGTHRPLLGESPVAPRPSTARLGGAFFFRSAEGQLYGVHTPPVDRDRGEGVLLCAPPGHEYLMTHRCLRLLAMDLSRAGFHVLRFDYSCMGSSWGAFEQARASRWVHDVTTAIRELSDRSHTSTISLVGLRLGAAIAYQAANDSQVKHLLLWDPVANGREYMERLRVLQARTHTEPPRARSGAIEELLGYFYPSSLVAELERLDLTTAEPQRGRVSLVLSEESPGATQLREHLALGARRPAVQLVPARSGWDDDNYTLSLTLHQARRAVVDLLGRGSP
jgi:alpha/beta superfamily hydrolase/acyl carrier protein